MQKTDRSFRDESCSSPSVDSSPNPSIDLGTSYTDPSPNPKVITRCYNRCNYVKPLTDFDKSKYTCRNCTSTKVCCLYCPSIVRYDGMNAHVKRQQPDVDIPKRFTRNLRSSYTALTPNLPSRFPDPIITQNEEKCSCKYYDFVSFLINNGINIEKVKENINLLKSINNLKKK